MTYFREAFLDIRCTKDHCCCGRSEFRTSCVDEFRRVLNCPLLDLSPKGSLVLEDQDVLEIDNLTLAALLRGLSANNDFTLLWLEGTEWPPSCTELDWMR